LATGEGREEGISNSFQYIGKGKKEGMEMKKKKKENFILSPSVGVRGEKKNQTSLITTLASRGRKKKKGCWKREPSAPHGRKRGEKRRNVLIFE